MNSERLVRIIAGSFILLSLYLASIYNNIPLFESANWLWFTIFVGANLLQSGITRWCLLEKTLHKIGIRSGCVDNSNTTSNI